MRVSEATLKHHYFEWNLVWSYKRDVSVAGSCIAVANYYLLSSLYDITSVSLSLCVGIRCAKQEGRVL